MLIIKATKDTLKDLNVHPELIDISDPFLNWHVNFFTLYGKKYYVFMNDLTCLSLTIPGIRKNQASKLHDIFTTNLINYFLVEGLPEKQINYYLSHCDNVIITKTDSRSIRSTLNEIMLVMKSLEQDKHVFNDDNERNKWNNRFIYKTIDYHKPIDVFIKILEEYS